MHPLRTLITYRTAHFDYQLQRYFSYSESSAVENATMRDDHIEYEFLFRRHLHPPISDTGILFVTILTVNREAEPYR